MASVDEPIVLRGETSECHLQPVERALYALVVALHPSAHRGVSVYQQLCCARLVTSPVDTLATGVQSAGHPTFISKRVPVPPARLSDDDQVWCWQRGEHVAAAATGRDLFLHHADDVKRQSRQRPAVKTRRCSDGRA